MVESIVTQIASDRKNVPSDFGNTYGLNVGNLISKFVGEDELARALQEAEEAKTMASQAMEREAELKIQVDLKSGWYFYSTSYCPSYLRKMFSIY